MTASVPRSSLLPAVSGEFHFWRVPLENWDRCLAAVREAGFGAVATYLSWRRHEPVAGRLDLDGRSDPRLDVRGFLRRCAVHDLKVHLKPGPWICAEEPGGGLPDWVLADEDAWALDADGRPVRGYFAPYQHPVPSYHHSRFRAAGRTWLASVDAHLGDLIGPSGPVVRLQVDNEPGWAFRDGPFEADYSRAAIAAFAAWPGRRHPSAAPPRNRLAAQARLLDWIAFKEWTLADYLADLAEVHRQYAPDVPLHFNAYPRAVPTIPQDKRLLEASVGLGGDDLYYLSPLDRTQLERACMDIATSDWPESGAYSPEIQAGVWRLAGSPPGGDPTPGEQEFFLRACLAFGVRSANFYMLVGRENWDLAPISPDGLPTPYMVPVRRAMELISSIPNWTEYQVERQVGVVLDRDAARLWHARNLDDNEARGADDNPWTAAFRAVLRAGFMPAWWIPSDDPIGLDALVRPLVGSTATSPSPNHLPLVDARSDVGLQLSRLGIKPPIVASDPSVLAIVHRRQAERILFLVNPGGTTSIRAALGSGQALGSVPANDALAALPADETIVLPVRSVSVYRLS